jgi:hypothetical protein
MTRLLIRIAAITAMMGTGVVPAATLSVWSVDPHIKVFKDTVPAEKLAAVVQLRAARNEFEPAQIAIRSDQPLRAVRVEMTPLRAPDGSSVIEGAHLSWNFVGFIPITKNTPQAEAIQIRAAPCEIPDPLLADRTRDIPADVTQPVWITVHVPADASPGLYRGRLAVIAEGQRAEIPIELTVDPFVLPDARHLWVTNWFSVGNIARAHHVELWSEPFWAMLEKYAQNMAAHRQNVVITPWTLVRVTRESDTSLRFDFSRFDRYVALFERAGAAERIEIGHIGHAQGGWGKPVALEQVRRIIK